MHWRWVSLLKWLLWLLLVLGLAAGAAVVALHQWAGSGDFRARLEREAGAALGVPLALGQAHVTLWPQPALALEGLVLQTEPPLTVGRAELRPTWHALLRGQRELETVALREAVLSQAGLAAALALLQKKEQETSSGHPVEADSIRKTDWVPRRLLLQGASWTDARGRATGFEAEARWSAAGALQQLQAEVKSGPWQGARLEAKPEGERWALQAALGGGTVQGHVQLRPAAPGARQQQLQGELETRGVELSALAAQAGSGGGPLGGRVDAQSTLEARFERFSALPEALRTHSRFTVQGAVLRRLDLAKAVATVGLSRGGETHFDTLAGELATEGRALHLRQLDARSGVLRASGEATVSRTRALGGRLTVDLTAGVAKPLLGVPLELGGTLEAPEITLSRGALLGAALGTAVVPGAGTAAGARLGDRLERGLKGVFGR